MMGGWYQSSDSGTGVHLGGRVKLLRASPIAHPERASDHARVRQRRIPTPQAGLAPPLPHGQHSPPALTPTAPQVLFTVTSS